MQKLYDGRKLSFHFSKFFVEGLEFFLVLASQICFRISKMTLIKFSHYLFPYFAAGTRTTTLLLRCVLVCRWHSLLLYCTGYRATTTRPNKVHDFSAYHFYTAFRQPDKSVPSSCFAFSKHHDRAKDFWMNQLDTCFSFYKQDLLEYF